MDPNHRAAELLVTLRGERPLIHHITNIVAANVTANVTLHMGALPVMAHAAGEVEDMVYDARALVLNVGTFTLPIIEAMLAAGQAANGRGVPVILDPVGAGATRLRTQMCHRILENVSVSVVRGNLGEVSVLAGLGATVRGVESIEGPDPQTATATMASSFKLACATTGRTDFVSDGTRTAVVENGHPWLGCRTGTGCSATAVVACFAAMTFDFVEAATAGLVCFGVAAELAAERASGPASFEVALHDALYHLTPEQVADRGRARWVG